MSSIDLNREALQTFIQQSVSDEMISHLAQQASKVIRCDSHVTPAVNPHGQPTPPSSPLYASALPPVETFIATLVRRSHVQVSTLMSSLVYLDRLRACLPPVAKGMRCTVHRIFLAALIIAAKNLNDSSPMNKVWARCTFDSAFDDFGFSVQEVNLMERQFLFLLNWDVRVKEEALFHHLEPFLAPIREEIQAQKHELYLHISPESLATRLRRQKLEARIAGVRRGDSRKRHSHRLPSPSVNNSPLSIGDHDRLTRQRHRTSIYRPGRSISPPSVKDVPSLSHTETMNSLSSRSSSIAPSSRGTPASLSTCSSTSAEVMVADARSPSGSSMCYSYVNIPIPEPKPSKNPPPSKKLKMASNGGGFMARFASAAGSYMQGRMGRPQVN